MIANTSRVRFVAAVLLALGVALASALAYAPVVLAQKIDTTPPRRPGSTISGTSSRLWASPTTPHRLRRGHHLL
jgi:hypothetical protein